jgi:hypothetical protein
MSAKPPPQNTPKPTAAKPPRRGLRHISEFVNPDVLVVEARKHARRTPKTQPGGTATRTGGGA